MKKVNLFVIGTGIVGGALLDIIDDQLNSFNKEQNIHFNLVGLADINKMIIKKEGIGFNGWKKKLSRSKKTSYIKEYISSIVELDLSNSILVDATASSIVVKEYANILENGISIVTPNKVANSSKTLFYKGIRDAATKGKSEFRYETNVGAALPIIDSLKDLMKNGDEISKIEGVFSGTLSYIFNSLKEGKKFSDVVKVAKKNGFTEPDPRDDLSGLDIARKLLILIRETGIELELEDIKVENLVPKKLQKIENVDEFLEKLKEYDSDFESLRLEAEKENKVLAYIAKYENGKAIVKVEPVDIGHPCSSLTGAENIVAFTSKYYNDIPLTIKGPGAGPEITASGIISDIFKIANSKG